MGHVPMVSIVPREAVRWHRVVPITPMALVRMNSRPVGSANVRALVVQMSRTPTVTVPRWFVTSLKISALRHLAPLRTPPEPAHWGPRVVVIRSSVSRAAISGRALCPCVQLNFLGEHAQTGKSVLREAARYLHVAAITQRVRVVQTYCVRVVSVSRLHAVSKHLKASAMLASDASMGAAKFTRVARASQRVLAQ